MEINLSLNIENIVLCQNIYHQNGICGITITTQKSENMIWGCVSWTTVWEGLKVQQRGNQIVFRHFQSETFKKTASLFNTKRQIPNKWVRMTDHWKFCSSNVIGETIKNEHCKQLVKKWLIIIKNCNETSLSRIRCWVGCWAKVTPVWTKVALQCIQDKQS